MKKILIISLLSMGYAFAEDSNSSQPMTSEAQVDQRQENQGKRIEQGVQSGELTEKEQHRLERKQRNIEKAQKRAEADGTVDDQEKRRLKRMQNRASREIYRKKHNERKR